MRVILVFLDGVGLGEADPDRNPLARSGALPQLESFMGRPLLAEEFPWRNAHGGGVALDATLGVPGLPQSATGQAALLTGINAPAAVGRHQNGFPGARLQRILGGHSIFHRLRTRGCAVTFANAFTAEYFAAVATGRWRHSATTLAALAGGVRLRLLDDLRRNEAVYQDLTREGLREWGYDVPAATPEEAGRSLAGIAGGFDFTLFEYFQTDVAGHRQDHGLAATRLRHVDAFLASLIRAVDPAATLVVVTSDHGNIEDLSTRGHTANTVPLVAFGAGYGRFLQGVGRLDEVAARLVSFPPRSLSE